MDERRILTKKVDLCPPLCCRKGLISNYFYLANFLASWYLIFDIYNI